MHCCIMSWLQAYGGQEAGGGGLKENGSHGPIGDVALSGGVALLEEVVTGASFEVQELKPHAVWQPLLTPPPAPCLLACPHASSHNDNG